jgi:superfamily I DNA/RNA helicase
MSLWWARRDQLDPKQIDLIENLLLRQNHLVVGPPGSGKTNVLLRRAQFVRTQEMPSVQVLTFTRPLTEFMKTGCYDPSGREIFPPSLINTVESWCRNLYEEHRENLPPQQAGLADWKRALAVGAMNFAARKHLPQYDAIFVDEAQDLLEEEVALISQWGRNLFFVGDDKQRIYGHTSGLTAVRRRITVGNEHTLQFHYRVAPELSAVADRILRSTGHGSFTSSGHYKGPTPGRVEVHGPLTENGQLVACADVVRQQLRVYADLIEQGDRIGIIVARRQDREKVYEFFEAQPDLQGKSKVIRARSGDPDEDYEPSFDDEPIVILTLKGCKGLEFRAVHWLFCERLDHYHSTEHYYTAVTRAKTRLDLYFEDGFPPELARAHSPGGGSIW